MGELSIFVDESGDFGETNKLPAYYLVSFVFHDQSVDIIEKVNKLQNDVKTPGFKFSIYIRGH